MTEQESDCTACVGCDDRDCPMASRCKLTSGHDSAHDFETRDERNARTGVEI